MSLLELRGLAFLRRSQALFDVDLEVARARSWR
jgi:hypothetical protein